MRRRDLARDRRPGCVRVHRASDARPPRGLALRANRSHGRARARVGGDPGAVPDRRGANATQRPGPLHRRRHTPQQPAQAGAELRGREGDRRRARAVRGRRRPPVFPRSPGIADVAANVLDGLLVDQVAFDLRRLAAINSFFVEGASKGTLDSPRAYRLARGHAPYRPIAYALVSPRRRGEIGRLADVRVLPPLQRPAGAA